MTEHHKHARKLQQSCRKSESGGSTSALLVAITFAALAVFLGSGIKHEPHHNSNSNIQVPITRQKLQPEPASESPSINACFNVQRNGFLQTTDNVHTACVSDFTNVDHLILELGQELYPEHDKENLMGRNGAKLYKLNGCRVSQLVDVDDHDSLFIVPVGFHFFWPLGKVGQQIKPKCIKSPVPGEEIVLEQLSLAPRVFSVSNFITQAEIEELLQHNKPLVSRSGVGYKGQYDNGDRTSSTSWDGSSKAAKAVSARSFQVLGWDVQPDIQDTLQILNYKPGEWYKPHLDSFESKTHKYFDPRVNNGTNRLATVFIYLSDVEEGGDTVFPHSTTHQGYQGDQIVHPNTIKTPGYIANSDARKACNYTSSALRTKPVAGDAIIFYSQTPEGEIDPYSLHGGCPPLKGEKWSANVWLWNRPKPSKENDDVLIDAGSEPSVKQDKHPDEVLVVFENSLPFPVELAWIDHSSGAASSYGNLEDQLPMNTYRRHKFRFENKEKGFKKVYTVGPDVQNGDVIDPANL